MRKSKFSVGTKLKDGSTITKVITKSTGYVEVTREDGSTYKDMAFNLTNENGEACKSKPKSSGMTRGQKKRARAEKELNAFNKLSNLQKIKHSILSINVEMYGDRSSLGYQLWQEQMGEIIILAEDLTNQGKANNFIADVCKTVTKYMKCSEKQAYCIARYADENGVIYKN